MYYCRSRYYDPALGRFINADAFASTGQGILGNNMFAYCGNNPVSRVDVTGHLWGVIFVGTVASVVASAVSSWITGEEFTVGDAVGAAIEGFMATSMTVIGVPTVVANPVATFCGEVIGHYIDDDMSMEATKEILSSTTESLFWTSTFKVAGKKLPKLLNGRYLDLKPFEKLLREATYYDSAKHLNKTSISTAISESFWASVQSMVTECIY